MARNPLSRLWRAIFPRHYRLSAPVNTGAGQTVVFLHGIANNHHAWDFVLPLIKSRHRAIALDLLGFGESPAPQDCQYTPADHAEAVMFTLRKMHVHGPIILVGHSMGALIAVEIVKQHPDFVKQLILCSMPMYRLADKRRLLPRQDDMYFSIYKQVLQRQAVTLKAFARLQRLAAKSVPGFGLTEERWHAFERSLSNTIINQTALDDIATIRSPISMLIGRLDMFLIRQYAIRLAKLHPTIRVTTLNEPHDIGATYARYVAEEVDAAIEGRPVQPITSSRRLKLPRVPSIKRQRSPRER